jgi:hypothetical protein
MSFALLARCYHVGHTSDDQQEEPMTGVTKASRILGVLRCHLTDETVLHTLVADLVLSLADADHATRDLFRLLGSALRGVPEHGAGQVPQHGRSVN